MYSLILNCEFLIELKNLKPFISYVLQLKLRLHALVMPHPVHLEHPVRMAVIVY
ncbi:MAG: hypothetical protein HZB41_00180 [Ignavibacteriae bacterium]|nr:hypothetical protein [Ignavibacteriota bacterium]